jgi:hypothetical protein
MDPLTPHLWRTVVEDFHSEWYCDDCKAGHVSTPDSRPMALAHTRETGHTTRAFWTNRHVFTGADLPASPPAERSHQPCMLPPASTTMR